MVVVAKEKKLVRIPRANISLKEPKQLIVKEKPIDHHHADELSNLCASYP